MIYETLGVLAKAPFLARAVSRHARRTVNIVYYHYVGRPAPHYQAFYSGCTATKFASDLRWLSAMFRFVTLDELLAGSGEDDDRSRPSLALTFDDGFDLCRNDVMQLLDDAGAKATAFVITSCIGNERMMWRHMLSAIPSLAAENVWRACFNELAHAFGFPPVATHEALLDASSRWSMRRKDEFAALLWAGCGLPPLREYLAQARPYFTWKGLRQWRAAGHAVGFHTHTHPFCSRIDEDEVDDEVVRPALDLQTTLGLNTLCLSYPFGDRLRPALEAQVWNRGVFAGLLGIGGFSAKGTPPQRLRRAAGEDRPVAWTMLRSVLIPPLRSRAHRADIAANR